MNQWRKARANLQIPTLQRTPSDYPDQIEALMKSQRELEPDRKGTLPRPGLAALALVADLLLGKGKNKIFANFLGGYSDGAEYYNNEALEKYRREHKKYQNQIDELNYQRKKQFGEYGVNSEPDVQGQADIFNKLSNLVHDQELTWQQKLAELTSYRDSLPFGSEQTDILNDVIRDFKHNAQAEKNVSAEHHLIRAAAPNAIPEQVEQLADIVRLFDNEFQVRFRERAAGYIRGDNMPGRFGGLLPASNMLGLASLVKAQIAKLEKNADKLYNKLTPYDQQRLFLLKRLQQDLFDKNDQDFSFTRNLRIPTLEQ